MATPQPTRQLSPLELLPGELRNLIYRYTVLSPTTMTPGAHRILDPEKGNIWRSNEPPLARTCKLLRHEVLEIYYKENTFTFPKSDPRFVHREHAELWLLAIGDEAVGWMEWVGAELSLATTSRPDGTFEKEACEVKARVREDILLLPTEAAVERPRNQPCECVGLDAGLCLRTSPIELSVSENLRRFCECKEQALEVCSSVLETLPRSWRLAYAVQFCSNYMCWLNGWDVPAHYPRSRGCRKCGKPYVSN